jgi:hypothetical protein
MEKTLDLDKITLQRYENLSAFERDEILRWIIKNLDNISVPAQIRKTALQRLQAGEHSFRSTLLLIRYAMSGLRADQEANIPA